MTDQRNVVGPQYDANGAMIVTGAGAAPATYVSSVALAASKILSAAPGQLISLTVTNTKGSAQFFQLHDSATLPADTAVPVAVISVAAGASIVWPLAAGGRSFANGIVVCNSSTAGTKTIGSADSWFDGQVA